MSAAKPGLRPFKPSDGAALAAVFRASILELTGEDYGPEQQDAWAAAADDEAAFANRLAGLLTLVAVDGGTPVGFISVKDNAHVEMLYVHPGAAGRGVARLLCDAAETLGAARGSRRMSVDASDTALGFFQHRGYVPQRRNSVSLGDVWLANTTLHKAIGGEASPR